MMTEAKRKEIMEAIGYEYSEAGIKKLQSDYMARKSDVDGIWGPDTENTALTVYYTKIHTKNFTPDEFKCECGGRYCCGFPDYMKPVELHAIQTIRDHYGKPIIVTSGLRCSRFNASLSGSISNSPHKTGNAIDFYQQGVTDTYAHRASTIEYMRTLPGFNYAYGNGLDSSGNKFSNGMGNAMHIDCTGDAIPSTTPAPKKETKITSLRIDGIAGHDTITVSQMYFGTVQDGELSGQIASLKRYFPAITAVSYGKGGSQCVRKIQAWVGATVDGTLGKETVTKWQQKLHKLGYYDGAIDGIFGPISAKAWQTYLNKEVFGIVPEKEPEVKKDYTLMVDVSDFQSSIDWAKVKAAGIKSAIIRCGGRGGERGNIYEDTKFFEFVKGAHSAGLNVGIYFLTQAINAEEGKEEAQYAIKRWAESGIPISFPICIDSEDVSWTNDDSTKGYGRANSNKLSKAKRTEAIKAFAEECKRQGYKSMIYASTSWLSNQVDMNVLSPIIDVWCAQWASNCEYKGKYIIWQYTSSGSVNGIKGNVDMDKCYIEPQKVNPPAAAPTPTPTPGTKKYTGSYPTEAEIRAASNIGIRKRMCIWGRKIAADDRYRYVYFDEPYGEECALCHPHGGKNEGWQCIGLGAAVWHHGGCIPTACHCGVVWQGRGSTLDLYEASTDAQALALAQKHFGVKDIQVIRNKNGIPKSQWQAGDYCCQFVNGNEFQHVFIYLGGGEIVDASGQHADSRKDIDVRSYSGYNAKVIIRYTGSFAWIQKGDYGEAVRKLQAWLNWFGGYGLDEDSDFGPKTDAALRDAQGKLKVTVDGEAGPKTFAAMQAYAK